MNEKYGTYTVNNRILGTIQLRGRYIGGPPKPKLEVEVKCPVCQRNRWISISNAFQRKSLLCKKCSLDSQRLPLNIKWKGKLTPIEIVGSRNQRTLYRFKCDCGGEIISEPHNCIRSCGCLRHRPRPDCRKPLGEAMRNHLWHMYRTSAKKRKLTFSISKEEFKKLTSQNCHYCGQPPSQKTRPTRLNSRNGDYTFNGLDRVDNAKGYTVLNVVPCCKQCNQAKSTFSETEFFEWIRRIAHEHRLCG